MSGAKSCLAFAGKDEMKISFLPLHIIWRGFLFLKFIPNSSDWQAGFFQDFDHIGFYHKKEMPKPVRHNKK
jgi:hypothetical protein